MIFSTSPLFRQLTHTFVTYLVASLFFQSLGRGDTDSTPLPNAPPTNPERAFGNGVREAGLEGKDIFLDDEHYDVKPSSRKAVSRLQCNSSWGGEICVAPVPRIAQQQLQLKSSSLAEQACVPTSMAMVLEAYFGNKPQTIPRSFTENFFSKNTHSERVWLLADRLGTSETTGTPFDRIHPLLDSISRDVVKYDSFRGIDERPYPDVDPAHFAMEKLQEGSLLVMNYSIFQVQKSFRNGETHWSFTPTGGHSVAVRGYEKVGKQVSLIYNDPWDGLAYKRTFKEIPFKSENNNYHIPYHPAWSLFSGNDFTTVALLRGFQYIQSSELEPKLLIDEVGHRMAWPGQKITYKWNASHLVNISSSYKVIGTPNCWSGSTGDEWIINDSNKEGSLVAEIEDCMAGTTYTLTVTGDHPVTRTRLSKTATLEVFGVPSKK